MSESKGIRKFEIGFHIIIFLFGIGIITSYILKDVQLFYVILGVGIAESSLFKLFKLLNKKQFS